MALYPAAARVMADFSGELLTLEESRRMEASQP
jgi:hypothetical protein